MTTMTTATTLTTPINTTAAPRAHPLGAPGWRLTTLTTMTTVTTLLHVALEPPADAVSVWMLEPLD